MRCLLSCVCLCLWFWFGFSWLYLCLLRCLFGILFALFEFTLRLLVDWLVVWLVLFALGYCLLLIWFCFVYLFWLLIFGLPDFNGWLLLNKNLVVYVYLIDIWLLVGFGIGSVCYFDLFWFAFGCLFCLLTFVFVLYVVGCLCFACVLCLDFSVFVFVLDKL